MKLEEFRVYQDAMEMGEKVWGIVIEWDKFGKDTMGKQVVRSADSVAANLSEGLGRFHYEETFSNFVKTIDDIGVKLNNYIRSIGSNH